MPPLRELQALPATRSPVAMLLAATIVASAWASTQAEDPKASVRSTAFDLAGGTGWSRELGYRSEEIYPLTMASSTGLSMIEVRIDGVRMSLLLDTGSAHGFMVTDSAPSVPYRVLEEVSDRDASGRVRGTSQRILADSMNVLGATFFRVEGDHSDWKLYASDPFPGTVGLDFFLDRRLTIDYSSRRVAVSAAPLPARLDKKRYLVLDLVQPPKDHGHLLYVRAVVNGRPAIVYLDTGYSASWIDPQFSQNLARAERRGGSGALCRGIPLELGGRSFVLDDLREEPIRRGSGLDQPVALVLGNDILSHFLVTIDLRTKKLVLGAGS